ncbi:hypothetical protein ACIPF8_08310 [Collimonas sp. NPDC087041]|uniref:hypothetical protein n=1 Tax=Collimonas sp. NPDC087041 TaxID=3363960 RepID=UPI0037F19716
MEDDIKQSAKGTGIIQVSGDLHIFNIAAPIQPEKTLSWDQRQQLTRLVIEVEDAEKSIISQMRIRVALNKEMGVKGVQQMTPEIFPKAVTYLSGWRSCALGEHQYETAMIAQVIRMWIIVPTLKAEVEQFALRQFATSTLKDLDFWKMRCVLSFVMTSWSEHWKRKDS